MSRAIGKPMPPWLIRKRSDDSGWTIWKWQWDLARYVAAADTATGAQALELFRAGAGHG